MKSCLTLCNPWTVAHQAPLSMGFSRQEYWSGLDLKSESHPVVSDSLRLHGLYSPWNSPGKNAGVGSLSLLQGTFLTQGSNPGLTWQTDSLPAEPPGKPKITGVGSLSLLQQIFPTQESNWGLLHCRWLLYQAGYQGTQRSPQTWP